MNRFFSIKNFLFIFLCGLLNVHQVVEGSDFLQSKEVIQNAVAFVPPQGWRLADKISLPKHVLVMVVGKGANDYPPSMNLGYDHFNGSIKEYLKIIKNINASQGCQLKDLGSISTKAGTASLSQFDEKTPWGEVRQMHAILLKDGIAYILTASALKDEFPKFYQDFFKSIQTLHFTSNANDVNL
ncbi:Uncharacterized protein PHSC3_000024 [Chlamydiales bacterium STE3]|nr:Uncharacterized protein PHSC3_000024 [Chlamydiales bacterium STE3]